MKCKMCGKEFQPLVPNQKFCSLECRNLYFNISPQHHHIVREVINSKHPISLSQLLSTLGVGSTRALLNYLHSKNLLQDIQIF